MACFLTVSYRVDRKDDFGGLAERVISAIQAAGEVPRIGFRFADAPAGLGGTGGVERLLKAYPKFAPYRADAEVTNMAEAMEERSVVETIAAAAVLEVARGVPRRFGFHQAGLFFSAGILDQAPQETPVLVGAQRSGVRQLQRLVSTPGIVVTSNWWTPRRMNALMATAKLREPGDLPPALRSLLDGLGKKQSQDEFVLPSSGLEAAENAAKSARADEAFERGRSAFRERIAQLPLHQLVESGMARPGESSALRERVANALKPLGYASAASHVTGILRFVKPARENHELILEVDRGTWSKSCLALIEIRTREWSRKGALPFSPDGQVRQFPLLDETQIALIASNLAIAAQEYEQLVYDGVAAALDAP